jgi:uncharacterized repeat protein (TIGR03803 family)
LFLAPAQAGSIKLLASFNGSNGAHPWAASLVEGSDGYLYGTTSSGGANNMGTIFRYIPGQGVETLASFDLDNGADPLAGLIEVGDGTFYGTTKAGGANDLGTVFQYSAGGGLKTLVSFDSTNGAYPYAPLMLGNDGNLYGTTEVGGSGSSGGTVFQYSVSGGFETLASLNLHTTGVLPYAGLVQASDGNLYGTATQGGGHDSGTIIQYSASGGLKAVARFNGTNGAFPYFGALVEGGKGVLYGTTDLGGAYGMGTVFRYVIGGGLQAVASFDGKQNGYFPDGGVIRGRDGAFYGTTDGGGSVDAGTIFRYSPQGGLETLASFTGANGSGPQAGLIQAKNGRFYGTTYAGGARNLGVIYLYTP